MSARNEAIERPRRPLVEIAAALAAGGVAGASSHVAAHAWLALAVFAACLALTLASPGARRASLLAACALASAARGAAARSDLPPPANGEFARGRWSSTGEIAGLERGGLERIDGRFTLPAGGVRDGELLAIRPSSSPGAFARGPVDGPRRTASSDAAPPHALALDEVARLAPRSGTVLEHANDWGERTRNVLLARLDRLEDERARGYTAALLLGDLARLPEGASDLFTRTGTYHVLAISGLQVALVAVLCIGPLAAACAGALRARGRRLEDALRALVLALFACVVGGGPPVVRSAIACALSARPHVRACARPAFVAAHGVARGVRLARRVDVASVWSLALALECLRDPSAAGSLSVQLSYGATLGLALLTGPIARHLRPLVEIAHVDRLGRVRSAWWRAPLVVAGRTCSTALAASCAAVIATLPFVWVRFGEWSPVGLVATPLLVPPIAAILVAGWMWLAAPGVAPEAALELPAHALELVLQIADHAPGSPCELPPRPLWLVLAATVAVFAAARARCSRPWLRGAALAGSAVSWPWTVAPRGLEVHALDVGHGTCVALRSSDLGTWIFDAGSRDRREVAREALAPLLRAWDCGAVSIAGSHGDRDHDEGLAWIAERFDARCLAGAVPARSNERPPHAPPRVDVAGAGVIELVRSAHGAMHLERGAAGDDNEGSRTLRVRYLGRTIVLCGDAEDAGLRGWLREAPSGPVDLLLWPHHGSDGPATGVLADALRPRKVWLSADVVPAITSELDRRGIAWEATARDGPLRFEVDPRGRAGAASEE